MILSTRGRFATRSAARRPGFTLLEVLVVVAILVILAGVAGVYVFGFLDGAKVDTARAQCEMFEKQCKAFNLRYNRAPQGLIELVAPQEPGIKPLVDGGEAALVDPWSKGTFQLASVEQDNFGAPIFTVICYENGEESKVIYSTSRTKAMGIQ